MVAGQRVRTIGVVTSRRGRAALPALAIALVLAAAPAHGQRVGSPVGTLGVEVLETIGPAGFVTNVVTARIDPDEVGEDFAGLVGYAIAVRAAPEWSIAAIGLPEGSEGALEPNDPPNGWFDIRVTADGPLPVADGRIVLAEILTLRSEGAAAWTGPTVEVLPSFRSPVPGWATWRESARTGTCSDSDPARRPCDRTFDRITPPAGWASDALTVSIPHVVVAPGERVTIPVLGRCLSQLLWARSFDLASLRVDVAWEGAQLDLAGGLFSRRAPDFTAAEEFTVDRIFDPARAIANTTERTRLFGLTFDVPANASGTIVRIDAANAVLASGGPWARGAFSGSVRVVDCTPADVDGDERITSADAVAVLRRRASDLLGEPVDARTLCTADVDRDGALTAADATVVLRRALGLPRAPGDRAVSTGLDARAWLERTADRLTLHVDGTTGVEVELSIGSARFGGIHTTRGDGPVAARARDGRLVVVAAHTAPTDRTLVLDLQTDGRVRLAAVHAHDASGSMTHVTFDPTPVTVVDAVDRFLGATPNPFNPSTHLRYRLAAPGPLRVELFDTSGRRVRSIAHVASGRQGHVEWNGRDDAGRRVASGVYHVRLSGPRGTSHGRVTLVE